MAKTKNYIEKAEPKDRIKIPGVGTLVIEPEVKQSVVTDRTITIDPDSRRRIEAIFQTTIMDGPELERMIKNLCTVKIGPVEVPFTDSQLARCQMQATFHGRTVEAYIQETVTELLARFMEEI